MPLDPSDQRQLSFNLVLGESNLAESAAKSSDTVNPAAEPDAT